VIDLATVTVEQFANAVGDRFGVVVDGEERLALELVEAIPAVKELPADSSLARTPFSLVFAGPAEPLLAQQIVPLQHPTLGLLEIFLVPVERGAAGARYEAVFS
jgi:hypothetical protein